MTECILKMEMTKYLLQICIQMKSCPECQSFFNTGNWLHLTPVRNNKLLYFADYGTWSTAGWYMFCNYLATINNLDTPVTKTADKTMKITYILQEE